MSSRNSLLHVKMQPGLRVILLLLHLLGIVLADNTTTSFITLNEDTDDLSYLVEFAVPFFEQNLNSSNILKVDRILEARRKPGNPIVTKVVTQVKGTNCSRPGTLDRNGCSVNESHFFSSFCNALVEESKPKEGLAIVNVKCGHIIQLTEPNEDVEERFQAFIKKFQKKYENQEEYNRRLDIFRKGLHRIKELNEKAEGKTVFGITQFADRDEHEFSSCCIG